MFLMVPCHYIPAYVRLYIITQSQVRDVVGTTICIVCANLEDYKACIISPSEKEDVVEKTVDWIIKEAISASNKCQKEIIQPNESVEAGKVIISTSIDTSNGETGSDVQEAVRFTETVVPYNIFMWPF